MAQAAYDYSDAQVKRRRPRQQPERKAALRVEQGGKRRLTPLQAAMRCAVQLVSLGLLVGFAVALIWSEAQIVELSGEIRTAKAELVSQQSQYDYYTTTLDSQHSITRVEDVSSQLGLVKVDESQITYIRLHSDSALVRRESTVEQWTGILQAGVLSLMGSAANAGN